MAEPMQTVSARELGAINWIGLRTLYSKEVQRFLKVAIQTVLAPVIQTLLFMTVLSLAWGQSRGDVLGVHYTQFLAPGLVMMAILNNAFQNTSSSLIVLLDRASWSCLTIASTPAACSPPITLMRLLGQLNKKRGSYARPLMP